MATYQVAWKASTGVATVQRKGDALPAGATKIGEFDHELAGVADNDDTLGHLSENHVLFHHVRDALYKVGVEDMQRVRIDHDVTYTAVTGISSTPATVNLANGATQQITNVISPGGASNTAVLYTTSNALRATVNSTGLITAGAQDGEVTITVTTVDGGFTDTVVVTVA